MRSNLPIFTASIIGVLRVYTLSTCTDRRPNRNNVSILVAILATATPLDEVLTVHCGKQGVSSYDKQDAFTKNDVVRPSIHTMQNEW